MEIIKYYISKPAVKRKSLPANGIQGVSLAGAVVDFAYLVIWRRALIDQLLSAVRCTPLSGRQRSKTLETFEWCPGVVSFYANSQESIFCGQARFESFIAGTRIFSMAHK
jgi:hypothetical protein